MEKHPILGVCAQPMKLHPIFRHFQHPMKGTPESALVQRIVRVGFPIISESNMRKKQPCLQIV